MAFDEDSTAFRSWLVAKVKQSRWVARTGEPVEQTAKRLGVQPDVIEQAQRELDEEVARAGRAPVELGSRTRNANRVCKWVDLDMPEEVYKDWQLYCESRQSLSPTAMLRSIVQTLLTGPAKPTWTGRGWVYRGRRIRMAGYGEYLKRHQRWPYHVRCDVTHGAMTALTWRAEAHGATVTGLVRGAVIDVLEGRTQRLLVAHSTAVMWDDPMRYWVPHSREHDGGR